MLRWHFSSFSLHCYTDNLKHTVIKKSNCSSVKPVHVFGMDQKCPDYYKFSRSVYMLRDNLGLLPNLQIIQVSPIPCMLQSHLYKTFAWDLSCVSVY